MSQLLHIVFSRLNELIGTVKMSDTLGEFFQDVYITALEQPICFFFFNKQLALIRTF